MSAKELEFEGVTGVGKMRLVLESDQHIYTFIGANGIGKTKMLEALFQLFLFSSDWIQDSHDNDIENRSWRFTAVSQNLLNNFVQIKPAKLPNRVSAIKSLFSPLAHRLPVIFLGAQSRGRIFPTLSSKPQRLGSLNERRQSYVNLALHCMDSGLGAMNMETSIGEWFVTLARSANPYQKREDNRDVEIKTVIRLLHEIDSRIDPDFLEIAGDDQVSLKIEGQKRELSQLSSGFTSILKLVQAIVSGYGFFTNETRLQNVKGIVLIDEIESHLHLTWQANIIPLLKKLFPNTVFYITTHSSVVLTQLKEGEAYTLYRDERGVVQTRKIPAPNNAALTDILREVFQVDLNRLKLENSHVDDQLEAKKSLLSLLKKQENKQ
ncbi:AAA family ATPase [Klebsiella spallanzanii]|uniref:AAA family ATPase n=1 Tax=Klebsiella spallanzanii TaxID=2587528 RepID=UPI00115A5B30|nr:AAA family ATPase [Klebsiella spallanzanii]VUS47148.1 DNA replication and repair protein RecF [Klebsiella spallanzanii]